MGLTDAEFGRLTLGEFELLSERLEVKREHDYYCSGIVSATIANVQRDPKHRPEPYSPMDFIPGHREEAKPVRVLTPEAQIEAFKGLFEPPPSRVIRIKE